MSHKGTVRCCLSCHAIHIVKLSFWEEFCKDLLVFSPVFIDLDAQSKKYLLAEDILENEARLSPNSIDLASSLTDDNCLL